MAEKKRNISIRLDAAGTAAVEEAKRMTGERTASKALLRMPGLARRWLVETSKRRRRGTCTKRGRGKCARH